MECLQKLLDTKKLELHIVKYDFEKVTRIREKIAVIFGRASTWDDKTISERYNITPDGDLIMILR
jgi:hypothetical protein